MLNTVSMSILKSDTAGLHISMSQWQTKQFQDTYEAVYKIFRTELIKNYTLTTINRRWEATQRVTAAKLTRLTHKISIQLHIVARSYTISCSWSRRPVRKLLDTP